MAVDFDTVIPYREGNLGKAYNEYMQKTDGWVLFVDHDILILRPEWYSMCQKAIEQHPDAGWISGTTNRIWDFAQKKAPPKDHDDIIGHIKWSNELYEEYGDQVIEHYGNRPMSGFFILTNKKAWKDVGGFIDGFLGIDNDYYNKLVAKGYKNYVIPGLYCYHVYDKKKYFKKNKKSPKASNKTGDKLYITMIMKNEAENLPRCLESAKNIADDIIIFDTGSTDDSVEIAKSYGATVIVPDNLDDLLVDTQFGKKVHFGDARNKCLEYVPDDAAWLLQIDCDEELELSVSKKELMSHLSAFGLDINGLTLDIKNMDGGKMDCQFLAPRIFRAGKVKYVNSIHNRPDIEGNKWGYVNQDIQRIALKHYGYDISEKKKDEKTKRTIGLLEKRIEENPNDHEVYFYLSQSYGWGIDDEKCLKNAIKYIEHRDDIIARNLTFNDAVFYTVACKTIDMNRYEDSIKWIKKGLELDGENIDLYYAMVRLGLAMKQIRLIISGAEGFLKLYGKYEEIKLTKGTRFVYNYSPEAYAFCTLHLTLAMFNQGAFLRHQFDEIVGELPDDTAQNFIDAFDQGIKNVGLSIAK